MIKRNEVLKAIKPYYDYFSKASGTATYPYRVLTIQTQRSEGSVQVLPIAIDYWDKHQTDYRIQEMVEQDCESLDGQSFMTGGIGFHAFCTSVIPLEDPERDIRRIRVTFDLRIAFGG